MVRVSIEVHDGAARFGVAVQAENIQRALNLAAARYPHGGVRIRFPIDPEGFFVEESTARAGVVGLEQRDRIAA
jgi:hypothetical protein